MSRLSEIDDILPKELPKESSKKGKATKRLIKEKEDEEKRRAEELTKSEAQVRSESSPPSLHTCVDPSLGLLAAQD